MCVCVCVCVQVHVSVIFSELCNLLMFDIFSAIFAL